MGVSCRGFRCVLDEAWKDCIGIDAVIRDRDDEAFVGERIADEAIGRAIAAGPASAIDEENDRSIADGTARTIDVHALALAGSIGDVVLDGDGIAVAQRVDDADRTAAPGQDGAGGDHTSRKSRAI